MDAVPHGMACRSVLIVVPVGRFREDQVVYWIVAGGGGEQLTPDVHHHARPPF